MTQKAAFATGVLSNIYEFHLYTGNSTSLCHTQDMWFQMHFLGWAKGFHIWLPYPPTCALRPVIPNNVCTLRITAAAGTELAGASSDGTVIRQKYFPCLYSSHLTELYDPKTFITHTASLRQGFPHCAIFPTAASRRSLDRVSVPVWLIILSDQLTILALVGRYPTNKLMVRELISKW